MMMLNIETALVALRGILIHNSSPQATYTLIQQPTVFMIQVLLILKVLLVSTYFTHTSTYS